MSASACHGFVLHRHDYRDTSLLVELFCVGRGRLPAVARGARRARSGGRAALLQPFQPLWLELGGRGEVRTLTRVEAVGRPYALAGRALLCGFYVNELLLRLLGREDPHDALLDDYQVALAALAAGDDLEPVLRRFELRLLDALGYGLALDVETATGRPVHATADYVFEPEQGLRAATATDDPRLCCRGATLQALAADAAPADAERAREARALLRAMLAPHLGERPLRTRALFQQWYGGRERSSPH
ncbi:MAG: DNA repair protein RecO [Marichromatium sp.]|nr:DNA repair protein RecO [Marichromatium sp.]